MIEGIIEEIKVSLSRYAPELSEEKHSRMYKVINPDIPYTEYKIMGVKTADIEKIVREIQKKYSPSFNEAKRIFKVLSRSNCEEYKFVAFFFLNRYKKKFNDEIPDLFRNEYFSHCHTWSSCDSCCIRVLGPFLAKNITFAHRTINEWAQDENLWVKRASMVLLLKVIMIHKEFDENYVFMKIDEMLPYSQQKYIEKGIGWLLKTCTKYEPELIFEYLIENKKKLTRAILRYASERLPKEKRASILK